MEECMRTLGLFILLVISVSLAGAQLTVTSCTPGNGATSVPTSATLAITFSAPLDTTKFFSLDNGLMSSLDTITAQWYSADRRTAYLNVHFAADKVHFVCVYWAPGDGGAKMAIPQLFTFATASAFPTSGYQASGTVSSGSTGVSPAYALVALTPSSIGNGKPDIIAGQVADAAGAFAFPNLAPGTYYPLAIRDLNQDGRLNPGNGDPISIGDPFTIVSSPISSINLPFQYFGPLTFKTACDSAAAIAATSLPNDRQLRNVYCWNLDTTGVSTDWTFNYTSVSSGKAYAVRIGTMEKRIEELGGPSADWFRNWKPITSPAVAVAPESVVVRTENGGGRLWRTAANTGGYIFQIGLTLGYLQNSQFYGMSFDTSKLYWGVEYILGNQIRPDSFATARSKKFIVDIVTANIVSFTDVAERDREGIADRFALAQNYPNPFNPSTTISYELPGVRGMSSAVSLIVYDMLGREVAVLVNETKDPGNYTVTWNAAGVTSGVYYYRLHAGNFFDVKKMIMLK
jgi:hypothetical protein